MSVMDKINPNIYIEGRIQWFLTEMYIRTPQESQTPRTQTRDSDLTGPEWRFGKAHHEISSHIHG